MFFGIIVDSKVISERKYFVIFANFLAAIPMYMIATGSCNGASSISGCLFLF
jgi:hypothetical protein